MSFPNKESRTKCWKDRDLYWKCLDEKNIEEKCKEFRNQYEKSCSIQWVKHFDRKREYLIFKKRVEKEGYVPEFPKKENLHPT